VVGILLLLNMIFKKRQLLIGEYGAVTKIFESE